jgi:hypothetical protein
MQINFLKKHFGIIFFTALCALHYTISLEGANSLLSIIYFFIGLCIIFYKGNFFSDQRKGRNFLLIKWIMFSVISVLFLYATTDIIIQHPLNYMDADMLPVIKEMGTRFLHHQPVYNKIPTIWNGIQPIYLPAMWLPYTVPLMFNIDIRWLTIMAIIASFLIIFATTKSNKQLVCASLFYGFTFYYLYKIYPEYIIYSEEGITLLYTTLLYYFIYKKNWTGIFLLVTILVLSRSWLLLSIPFIVFYYFKYETRKKTLLHIAPSILLCIFCILITPVAQYKHWLNLPQLYSDAAVDSGNGFKYIPVFNKFGLVKILKYEYRYMITYIGFLMATILMAYFTLFTKGKEDYLLKIITATLFCFFSCIIIPYEYLVFTILFGLFNYLHFNHNFLKRNQ